MNPNIPFLQVGPPVLTPPEASSHDPIVAPVHSGLWMQQTTKVVIVPSLAVLVSHLSASNDSEV
jgi:hypothetical protein